MDKTARRAATREYKDNPRPIGIFRVHNTVEDKSLVASSLDLPASLNGQKARLQLGGHQCAELQNDWKRLGAEAFAFEVLDTLERPERPDYDPREDLRVLEQLWLDRLSPFDERGYNTRPKARG